MAWKASQDAGRWVFQGRLTTLAAVLNKYALGKSMFDVPEMADADSQGEAMRVYQEQIRQWLIENMSLLTLLLVPLQAATFKLAFKSWRDVNYPEWLVVAAFLTTQSMLFMVLLIAKPWLPYVNLWMGLVAILAGALSLVQLFSSRPRSAVILRGLLGYILYYLISSLIMVFAGHVASFWLVSGHASGAG